MKSRSDMPIVSRTSTRVAGPDSARALSTSSLKWTALANQSGVAKRTTSTPGSGAAWTSADMGVQLVVPGTCPIRCSWGRARQADPVEDGQSDGDGDALFHPDQDDDQQRDRRQAELERVEAGDRPKVPPLEQADAR